MLSKFDIIKRFFSCNILGRDSIVFISEPADWVIQQISKEMIDELEAHSYSSNFTYTPYLLRKRIIHFASMGTLIKHNKVINSSKSNKVVLTWYHVVKDDPRNKFVQELNAIVDIIHTACSGTREQLIRLGCDPHKIVVIPESIDVHIFKRFTQERKIMSKEKIGLPQDKIIIGSFQKDGDGWGEGIEPKLVKGPDIFCDVVEKLAKQFDIHILLTGPARGYVTQRLKKAGISYTHHYLKNYFDIVEYYNCLDAYLVTSRVEGGPKAILESLSCGVPLISTRVGMAPDVIADGVNGMLSPIEDVGTLYEKTKRVLLDESLRSKLIHNGLETVKEYSLEKICQQYIDKIYSKLV
ncbi:MAG: glycosyltransferase family 4 protein [Candidatus Magasanikbacteria bacterium]